MGRGRIIIASVESSNTVNLDPPYGGSQRATLYVRKHPAYGTDVYIVIERGQMLDSRFHKSALVRFDGDKPIKFSTVGPDDLSSNALFLQGQIGPRLINRMKVAKRLLVQVPVYQAGTQEFDFSVGGFKWRD
jgi:hypothetical protein